MLVVKNPPDNTEDARDTGSIPGSGRSPGGGNGNPLQYFCLENPVDRGAWWALEPKVTWGPSGGHTCCSCLPQIPAPFICLQHPDFPLGNNTLAPSDLWIYPLDSKGWTYNAGLANWHILEESDTTERLHFHFSLSCTGEGNGNPLQYSCLENPRYRSLVGCRLWGRTESDTTEVTKQQQNPSDSNDSFRMHNWLTLVQWDFFFTIGIKKFYFC